MARSSSKLLPEDTLVRALEILKAVAHPGRLQIVNVLLRNECRVGELAKALGAKQSLTSLQLSKLKSADVLKSRRDWNKVYYSLANNSIKKIVESIIAEI